MKLKLTILFFIISSIVFMILNFQKNKAIESYLERKTQKFELAYRNIFETKEELADFIFRKMLINKKFRDIYKQINSSSEKQKDKLREKLYALVKSDFEQFSVNKSDTIHFHLKNNHSFLRMHNPKNYGDDLSHTREMVACANSCIKKVTGFEQGKILSAYRFVYPIVIDKEHLGSMEIAFSINSIASKIMGDYKVLSSLFIKNEVLENKLKIKKLDSFKQSIYAGYCYDKSFIEIIKNYGKTNLKQLELSEKVNKRILDIVNNGVSSSIYAPEFQSVITVIPIWNEVSKKLEAFAKVRENTSYIKTVNLIFYIALIVLSIIILLVIMYIYNQNEFSKTIKTEKQLVQNVLDSISNITFVTDFKALEYANLPFLNFFGVKNIEEFNKKFPIFNEIFLEDEEFLHKKLGMSSRSFSKLIINTDTTRRKVKIYNKNYEINSFHITISSVKYTNSQSYLLTLTDITQEEILKKEIEKKAYYDSLTNIYNRNKFNELFGLELNKAKRYGRVFSLAIIDIDKFKSFNDNYGHLIGDEILKLIANDIEKEIRSTDIFARWGGEEFVILFSDTSIHHAYSVCEKLRVKISKIKHKVAGSITVSMGLSEYKKDDSIDTIFKRADSMLYLAKESGRNRVQKDG